MSKSSEYKYSIGSSKNNKMVDSCDLEDFVNPRSQKSLVSEAFWNKNDSKAIHDTAIKIGLISDGVNKAHLCENVIQWTLFPTNSGSTFPRVSSSSTSAMIDKVIMLKPADIEIELSAAIQRRFKNRTLSVVARVTASFQRRTS